MTIVERHCPHSRESNIKIKRSAVLGLGRLFVRRSSMQADGAEQESQFAYLLESVNTSATWDVRLSSATPSDGSLTCRLITDRRAMLSKCLASLHGARPVQIQDV